MSYWRVRQPATTLRLARMVFAAAWVVAAVSWSTARGQGPVLAPAAVSPSAGTGFPGPPAATAVSVPAPAQGSAYPLPPVAVPSAAPAANPAGPAPPVALPAVSAAPAAGATPAAAGAGKPVPETAESPAEEETSWWPLRIFRPRTEVAALPQLPSALALPEPAGPRTASATSAQVSEDGQVVSPAPLPAPEEVPAPPGEGGVPPGATTPAATTVITPPPKLWTGNVDLGLNGSEGNSKLFNVRGGLVGIRETPFTKLTLKLNYLYTDANRMNTANRLFFDGRHEWVKPDSPWSAHIHETTEYDQFASYDCRITLDSGLGYKLIKNDVTTLTGRFGPGVSREFGSPDTGWTPELVFGSAFERVLSQNQKLITSVDFFPDVTNFGNYRVNSQAAWQITIDQVNNLSLKFSVTDRYDSTPHGSLPNDVDYATTLVWSF